MPRISAVLRGMVTCAVLWGMLGALAFLVFRALDGDAPADLEGPVRALRLGVFAFVVAVAALGGAWVSGSALVDARVPRGPASAVLAGLVPVAVVVGQRFVATDLLGRDRAQDLAFLAAAVAGGLAGAVLSVVRARDDDRELDSFARRSSRSRATGWGSR